MSERETKQTRTEGIWSQFTLDSYGDELLSKSSYTYDLGSCRKKGRGNDGHLLTKGKKHVSFTDSNREASESKKWQASEIADVSNGNSKDQQGMNSRYAHREIDVCSILSSPTAIRQLMQSQEQYEHERLTGEINNDHHRGTIGNKECIFVPSMKSCGQSDRTRSLPCPYTGCCMLSPESLGGLEDFVESMFNEAAEYWYNQGVRSLFGDQMGLDKSLVLAVTRTICDFVHAALEMMPAYAKSLRGSTSLVPSDLLCCLNRIWGENYVRQLITPLINKQNGTVEAAQERSMQAKCRSKSHASQYVIPETLDEDEREAEEILLKKEWLQNKDNGYVIMMDHYKRQKNQNNAPKLEELFELPSTYVRYSPTEYEEDGTNKRFIEHNWQYGSPLDIDDSLNITCNEEDRNKEIGKEIFLQGIRNLATNENCNSTNIGLENGSFHYESSTCNKSIDNEDMTEDNCSIEDDADMTLEESLIDGLEEINE